MKIGETKICWYANHPPDAGIDALQFKTKDVRRAGQVL
jgi:hypothetical protein